MPELAKRVTVDHDRSKLYVDGVEFPWRISDQGPVVADADGSPGMHVVTVSILAEDVEIIPTGLREESPELFMARRRLTDAHEALAYAHERARPDDGASQLDVQDAMLGIQAAQAELKRLQ